MKEWHPLAGLQSCLGPVAALGPSQMTKCTDMKGSSSNNKSYGLLLLTVLRLPTHPFDPVPAPPNWVRGVGSQNRKGQKAEEHIRWIKTSNGKVPALRRDFSNIKKWEKEWRTSRDLPLLPLHLSKWIWALRSQEYPILGFTPSCSTFQRKPNIRLQATSPRPTLPEIQTWLGQWASKLGNCWYLSTAAPML